METMILLSLVCVLLLFGGAFVSWAIVAVGAKSERRNLK
jgi:hypothetical protein